MSLENITEVSSFISGEKVAEDVSNLFCLYGQLIQPLQNFEKLCDRQETLNKEIQEARDTLRAAFVTPIVLGLQFTIYLSIPFVVLFLIITNVVHTEGGILLFTAYDNWLTNTAFGVWFFDKMSSMNSAGLFVGFLGVVISLLVGCALFPIVVFLFPAMLVIGILITIISVISAKSTIKNGCEELAQLDGQIDDMVNELAEPLFFVPPDYRYSVAVEHFWKSYNNGRASTLKEAINLFDNYMYQMKMEERQQQIIDAHKEISQKLDAQSAELASLNRQMKKVKDQVDWMYWWS